MHNTVRSILIILCNANKLMQIICINYSYNQITRAFISALIMTFTTQNIKQVKPKAIRRVLTDCHSLCDSDSIIL